MGGLYSIFLIPRNALIPMPLSSMVQEMVSPSWKNESIILFSPSLHINPCQMAFSHKGWIIKVGINVSSLSIHLIHCHMECKRIIKTKFLHHKIIFEMFQVFIQSGKYFFGLVQRYPDHLGKLAQVPGSFLLFIARIIPLMLFSELKIK